MGMKRKLPLFLLAAAGLYWLAARRRHWRGFEGRVVLITGGTRGLGLALARRFLSLGARVAVCGRDEETLERAREQLGHDVFARACDVTEAQQVRELVREVERRYGRIDVLINNAGVIQVGPMEEMTIDDYEEAMDTHYWGPVYASLAALPGMRRRRDGRIVNIASIGGKVAVPHLLPYDGSKFALVGFSEGLRAEAARDHVYVTTVCPWLMRTGSPRHAFFKGRHEAESVWFTLADALPLASMSAESAARRIVEACRRGEAEVVLTLKGKAAAALRALFPGPVAGLLSLMNRLLPRPGGIGRERRKRAALPALTEKAARAYNQDG